MKNLANMMKQAQQMKEKMGEMQEKLESMEQTGQAGGGMVEVTLSGKFHLRKISIDRSIVNPDDVEVLEDLITAAFNDAAAKVSAQSKEEMEKLTGGLNLPAGFKLPF